MDAEYKKNVRLTDSLRNDQDAIVASPRLRDMLVGRLGKKIEVLPVWIKDHKGRIATKDYSFINVLDLQDCVALTESGPDYATMDGEEVILGFDKLTLETRRIGRDSR